MSCWIEYSFCNSLAYLNFTLMQADVVAFSSAHFGAGAGSIYLDDVDCTGIEGNLIDCPHSSFVSCYSGHSEDAGVRCQGGSAYT